MIKLVCDNLNTHHIGSLYYASPAEPEGLNIAETELIRSRSVSDWRIENTIFTQLLIMPEYC